LKYLVNPFRFFQTLALSLILISFSLLASPIQAAEPPLPIERYWQQVQETQQVIAGLENASAEAQRTKLAALADQWAQITQVSLPDGTLLTVDHSFLVSQLRATPPDLIRLEELLAAFLATRDTWPRAEHTSAELDPLKDILARPEFRWRPKQPSLLELLWRRFWEYFWELARRWLPEESLISLQGSFLNYVLTGLGLLLLVVILGFIGRELLANFVTEAEFAPASAAGAEVLTADTAFARAQELSHTGDYRTAVRYLYLSSLLLLDERDLLRYNRTQTNREYLRSVAHLPKLAATLREVIDIFDRVWYGYQPLDETAYAHYAARVAELRQQK
jgi:hypothetical protein